MKYQTMIRCRFILCLLSLTIFTSALRAQESKSLDLDRFADISKTEAEFTASNVLARMVEGLGFRYYWASKGLVEADLTYSPSTGARNGLETLTHIHGLSEFMLNLLGESPAQLAQDDQYLRIRSLTLINLEKVLEKIKMMKANELETIKMGEVTI